MSWNYAHPRKREKQLNPFGNTIHYENKFMHIMFLEFSITKSRHKLFTCTAAIASTAPAAPNRWPIIDFVEFTLNCRKHRSYQVSEYGNLIKYLQYGIIRSGVFFWFGKRRIIGFSERTNIMHPSYLRILAKTMNKCLILFQVSSWRGCSMCIYVIHIFPRYPRLS